MALKKKPTEKEIAMPFIKKNFTRHNGYVSYDNKFVARFKTQRKRITPFIKFLVSSVSPEDYFARLDAGETPVGIVKSMGYECPILKAFMVANGISLTR